jgi:hypothetical protein
MLIVMLKAMKVQKLHISEMSFLKLVVLKIQQSVLNVVVVIKSLVKVRRISSFVQTAAGKPHC